MTPPYRGAASLPHNKDPQPSLLSPHISLVSLPPLPCCLRPSPADAPSLRVLLAACMPCPRDLHPPISPARSLPAIVLPAPATAPRSSPITQPPLFLPFS